MTVRPRWWLSSVVTAVSVLCLLAFLGGGSSLGLILFALPILFAAYVAGLAVAGLAFVVGLPLRQWPAVRSWWAAHPWLSWALAAAGIVLLVLTKVSATSDYWIDDEGIVSESFDLQPVLAVGAVCLIAFGLLWAPRRLQAVVVDPPLPSEVPWGDGGPVDR